MPRIQYEEWSPRGQSRELVRVAREIIREYADQDLVLTLRQLYYQFVARDLIPNSQKSYNRLGNVVSKARRAGLIDWEAIEDRTREFRSVTHWESPQEILTACASSYRIDKWAKQSVVPEVWVEKEALVGVFERVCRELDVMWFACRGYASDSSMWRAGRRVRERARRGVKTVILHFGDHDPSGVDMTRDIRERVFLFADLADVDDFAEYRAYDDWPEDELEVRRVALNMDQIRTHRPPPNPAKLSDARAQGYIERFGRQSWELDALEPRVLQDLVRQEILSLRDDGPYEELEEVENVDRETLELLSQDYDQIKSRLRKK